MRIPAVQYITLAISGLGSLNPTEPEPTVATGTRCWTSSAAVSANWGPLRDLRIDAAEFCGTFTSNNSAVVISSGKLVFGWQSAIFLGNFASWSSCMTTFNNLVTTCYGTGSATVPVTLGGSTIDPGGANLVISFGDGAQF